MPVFHTKIIESILEPVAQQVSKLVILHEEAEDGNAMPDLARPVQTVKAAVDNLIKVGYETIDNSEDLILKQDMPPALQRVEEASVLLLQASDMLRADPYSAPARKKLIEGSRGILQGTSALLLAFDESEVRKIIRICKNVLEYLAITEVVDSMEDLVIFVKNLSPVLTKMTKQIDSREKELTHHSHRQWLMRSLEQVKELTPILISSVKNYITNKGTPCMEDAQQNRNYVVQKMSSEIHELMRVLQLTTCDEDEWDADHITIIKKALSGIKGKMKQAQDWLADSEALPGSAGERALRQILEDALRVADRCSNEQDRDLILHAVSDIESMCDALNELRAQGKGNSPQAMSLARGIQQKLHELQDKVATAIANTERSGIKRPAHTLQGKVDQIQRWLANPNVDDKHIGEEALHMVVAEARRVAQLMPPGVERDELLRAADHAESLANELTALIRQGKGDSPQARAIAAQLSQNANQLRDRINDALVNQVANDFMDISTPLKQMSEAALAPPGVPNRESAFEDRANVFMTHADRMSNTAYMLAAAGGAANKHGVEAIQATCNQVNDLTPEVVKAARIVLTKPDNQSSLEHFELLKKQWLDNMEILRSLVDDAIDTEAFIRACEEAILQDTENCEQAIRNQDPAGVVTNTSNIARRANRVLQVAQQDVDNNEDRAFIDRVSDSIRQLRNTISPMVQNAKAVAHNPRDPNAAQQWRNANNQLISSVGDVRRAVSSYPNDHMTAANAAPDLSQLSINEHGPPRPPLPNETAPPRPPPPETDDEDELSFPVPQANQPIMMAAHALHMDVKQWSSRDNDIIAAAKRMALLMAKLSQLVRGEGGRKKDLISTAIMIAESSDEVVRLAKLLARECTDKRMRTALLQVCERIPTQGTQLKILSTVKATMLGAQDSEEDQNATEMLVGNAQALMQSVRETVRAAEAASIKIRVDSGYTIRWLRKRPWYT